MSAWTRYLVAFVLLCHGLIYIRIGSILPAPIPQWAGTSWLLGTTVTGVRLQPLVVGLHVLAGVATIACAAAILFAPSGSGWWPPLAVAAGAIGLAAFAVFWDGQTKLLVAEGAIGAVVSALLLVAGLTAGVEETAWLRLLAGD